MTCRQWTIGITIQWILSTNTNVSLGESYFCTFVKGNGISQNASLPLKAISTLNKHTLFHQYFRSVMAEEKQVWRTGTRNSIPQILSDASTCPCLDTYFWHNTHLLCCTRLCRTWIPDCILWNTPQSKHKFQCPMKYICSVPTNRFFVEAGFLKDIEGKEMNIK